MFIIADGNNLAWAGFHALRRPMGAETPEELTRAALLGLSGSVLGLIARSAEPPDGRPFQPMFQRVKRFAIVFDEGRPLRRRAIYPAYQTGREGQSAFMDNEPYVLAGVRQFLEGAAMMPIIVLRGENTEADDLICALALKADPGEVRIASTDRDFLQLVDERVSIYSPVKKLVIDAANFSDVVSPSGSDNVPIRFPRERYLDYRVASGDASDDLPGIPGVGTLTAAKLLAAAPLDAYFERPALAAEVTGRRNAKLELALTSEEARTIVARNRALMDLRAAATLYPALDPYTAITGKWDEAGFREWMTAQRMGRTDVDTTVQALSGLL